MTWEDIKRTPVKVIWKESIEGLLVVGSDEYIRILHNATGWVGSLDDGSKIKYPQYKYGYAFSSNKYSDFNFEAQSLRLLSKHRSSNLTFRSVKKFNL